MIERRFVKLTFAILAIGVLSGVASAQQLTEILRRIENKHKALSTLQASIAMEKYNAQIDETDKSSGKLKYLPKTNRRVMYVRVDWLKPVAESMAVIGDTYTLYRPALKQVYKGRTNDAKNNAKAGGSLAFLSMSRKELTDNYTIRVLGNEVLKNGIDAIHLELTPKTASKFKMAHIWVDGNGTPMMTRVIEKNNDATTILLSNLVENESIKGADFEIKFPPSIEPIR